MLEVGLKHTSELIVGDAVTAIQIFGYLIWKQGQTRIGCGIAGFTDNEISPLFEKAHDVENIVLPPGW